MKKEDAKIIDNKLVLSKQLRRALQWKYPFYRIPKLEEYSQRIIDFSKKNNQLPFYSKFDINNDGKEEIMIIQRSIFGGYGRLVIIFEEAGKFKFNRIKWRRPVSSLFFDYLIDVTQARKYETFGFHPKKVTVKYQHIITKGYLIRIVYWDGFKYCQEKVGFLNN